MFVLQRTGRQKDTSSAANRFGSEVMTNKYLIKSMLNTIGEVPRIYQPNFLKE